MSAFDRFIALVQTERERQAEKWGEPARHPHTWITILSEELGEVSRAVLHGNKENLIEELVQVAAVAEAFFEQVVKDGRDIDGIKGRSV